MIRNSKVSPPIPAHVWIVLILCSVAPLVFVYLAISGTVSWRLEGAGALVFILIALADLALFFLVATVSILAGEKTPTGMLKLSSELGISFKRRWGSEGSSGKINLFGVGPYFEAPLGDSCLSYLVAPAGASGPAVRISIHHPRSLRVGLCYKFNLMPLFRIQDWREQKSLLARRVPTDDERVKCWAVRRQRARALLEQPDFKMTLSSLVGLLEQTEGALVVRDARITVLLSHETSVSAELIEMMQHLSLCAVA